MFDKSVWIWTNNFKNNDRVNFFVKFTRDTIPHSAVINVGTETKYYLFVNGKLVVFDGGLFRESTQGCGYYDKVDLAPYLKQGENEIVISVWYFGNGGRNNVKCEKPGLIFECDALSLYSGTSVLCERAEGYYDTLEENPSYLYGGYNTAYSAQKQAFSLCPLPYKPNFATVIGKYGDAPWGRLEERSIPLFYFGERVSCEYTRSGEKITVKLPYAMHFSPFIKVKASGGEKIDMRSDRYAVNGGPGDFSTYYGQRAEYVCREGEQEYEVLNWFFGESIIFTLPKTVEILSIGYRESGYPTKITCNFSCDDDAINTLFDKCVRTLLVCMRENFMDCPDRERGQWIGDVSVQAPQVVYLLDKNALMLLKKSILDFIRLRKGDRLVGNVPGENFMELPAQSLNAISELGMVATYWQATEDKDVLLTYFEPAVKYLELWETDDDGVVLIRNGDWNWFDHLFNVDDVVLNQCWYYSAAKFALRSAEILGNHKYDEFLNKRIKAIENNFEKRYWNGSFYSSGKVADDRANAMAVLVGLCKKEHYPVIRFMLNEVANASTYMEGYVLSALCEMGYKEDAIKRMKRRYSCLIDNENSTLWEDFNHLGTKNHAWSGSPVTVLLRYFAGVNEKLERKDVDISPLKFVKCSFQNKME